MVGGAVAPPTGELLRLRRRLAQQVQEAHRAHQRPKRLDLHRRVADDPAHVFVVPHVELARRDVQIAGDDQRRLGVAPGHLAGQAFVEIELVVELLVQRAVRRVAAGRYVEVLNLHPGHLGLHAAGVALPADVQGFDILERQP